MPNSPLRILQVLRAPIGGLFRHVADLSKALAERGHQVGLVVDGSLTDARTDILLADLQPHLSLGIHKLPMARVLGMSDVTTPIRLKRLAKSLNIEVLHGHGAKGGFNARLGRPRNCVVFYTPHGGVLHFDQTKLPGKIFRQIEGLLLRRTDGIIFESTFAQKEYVAQIAQPDCPAPVIHNGLADPEFIPIKAQKDAKDFAYIGELRGLKGVAYLLNALVGTSAPDGRPASLVMAGDGPMRTEIEELVVSLGLTGRVELVGVRPAREVLAKGRCLVVPSLKESLPYVVLEASAASRPVIATQVGGIHEIFGPTASALIRPADENALRKSMQAFLDDEAAAKKEAKARLAHVRTTFSLLRMTDEIETLYKRVLENS